MGTIFGVLGVVAAVGLVACGDDKVTSGKDTTVTTQGDTHQDSTVAETTTPTDTTATETTATDTTATDTTTTDTTVTDSTETDTTTTDTTVTDTTTTDTTVTDTTTTDTTVTDTTTTDTTVTDTTTTDTTVTDTTTTDTTVTDTATTDTTTDTSASTPTEQIQAVLDALGTGASAAGPFTVSGAYVTYLKPALGDPSDVEGFFIQAAATGPALFVEWSGTSKVAVGDIVTVAFATVGRNHTPPSAKGVTAVTVTASGKTAEVTALSQELTAVDFVTALGTYENEIIDIAGEVTSQRAQAGVGFESVKFDNDVVAASPNLELRYPATLGPEFDLGPGCLFQLAAVPVWRFDAHAQVLFIEASELDVACDAPKVVSAKSLGPTSAAITFDRALDPDSVDAVAAQVTFDGGLVASAGAVDGRVLIVTTGPQTGGHDYTVTIDDTITDVLGSGVDATHNTATFKGFAPADHLVISEFDYDQEGTDAMEFVEIYNPTDAGVSLVGWNLVGWNGANGTSYKTTHLDAAGTLPAHSYLVVGSLNLLATVTGGPTVLKLRFDQAPAHATTNEVDQLQNGAPDALRLENASATVIDAVSYEGSAAGGVEGTGLLRLAGQYDEDVWVISDFQRCPDGGDTNENSKDFKFSYPPSPGAVNGCGAPQALP